MKFTLREVIDWTEGMLVQGSPRGGIEGLSTDTRTLKKGEGYIALKGERFDGHKFVSDGAANHAGAIVVSNELNGCGVYSGAVIQVKDTLLALQGLARGYREKLRNTFVIGVTGSSGKTSTKDFLRAILSKAGSVSVTEGNYNNHIGLPLTVLGAQTDNSYAVWEMGMSQSGEIGVLAEIASPKAGVITNIGSAHLESFSSRDEIAAEKGRLAEALPSSGFLAMPAKDKYFQFVSSNCSAKIVSTGIGVGSVHADRVSRLDDGMFFAVGWEGQKPFNIKLGVHGVHMVENSLLAIAVAKELGVDIDLIIEGLKSPSLTGGRLQFKKINNTVFIDDSYNANPESVKAAISVLSGTPASGKRYAVLGAMAELGEKSERLHRDIGLHALDERIDTVVAVGKMARAIYEEAGGEFFDSHESAVEFLQDRVVEGDVVLVKGSRSARMDKIFNLLQNS